METAAAAVTILVALLHLGFMAGETVGWKGMARRFGLSKADAETTRSLALNQGFYNGGVAALLLWAQLSGQGPTVLALLLFIVAMSIVGALSVRWTIFVLQGLPALLALALHLLL